MQHLGEIDDSGSLTADQVMIDTMKAVSSISMDLQKIFKTGGVKIHYQNADPPSGRFQSIGEFNKQWSTLRFGGPSRLGGAIQSLWSETVNDSLTFVKPRIFYVFTDGDVCKSFCSPWV